MGHRASVNAVPHDGPIENLVGGRWGTELSVEPCTVYCKFLCVITTIIITLLWCSFQPRLALSAYNIHTYIHLLAWSEVIFLCCTMCLEHSPL